MMAVWASAFPHLPVPRTWIQAVLRPHRNLAAWRTAIVAQFPLAGLLLLVVAITTTIDSFSSTVFLAGKTHIPATVYLAGKTHIPDWLLHAPVLVATYTTDHAATIFAELDNAFPVLRLLISALLAGTAAMLVWLALAAFGKRMFRRLPYAVLVLGALLSMAMISSANSRFDLVQDGVELLFILTGFWALYRLFLRTQPLAIFVAVVTCILGKGSYDLLWFPSYRPAAIAIGVTLVVLYGWAIVSTGITSITRRRPAPLPETALPPVGTE
jgi:hypothetical protein